MSGKDEKPKSITFKDGIDFFHCENCSDFEFWECYGALNTIYLNPKEFITNIIGYRPVAIYNHSNGERMDVGTGRFPSLREVASIDKITCNQCRSSPNNENMMIMLAQIIEYIIWVEEKGEEYIVW